MKHNGIYITNIHSISKELGMSHQQVKRLVKNNLAYIVETTTYATLPRRTGIITQFAKPVGKGEFRKPW